MPRKINKRKAEQAERRKAEQQAEGTRPRVGLIAHGTNSTTALVLAAMAAGIITETTNRDILDDDNSEGPE